MSETLSAEYFAPHVGKTVRPAGQHLVLTLVAVDMRDHPGWDAAPRKPFSLILRGAPADILPEGLYACAFGNEPSVELYIMPIHTPSREHQDYQVVFN
jgi:hypothetical protein